MILEKEQLLKIKGGDLNSTFLNAIARVGTFVFELGQALGGAIRRSISGKKCPL